MFYYPRVIELPFIWLFQRFTEEQFEIIQRNLAQQQRQADKVRIFCRFCQHQITSHTNKMEVNGQYRHVFSNPSGFVFEIGCFSAAEGCSNKGIPNTEYTWFTGYYWNFAICSNCYAHLGWFYQATVGESSFYGLILGNLVEEV